MIRFFRVALAVLPLLTTGPLFVACKDDDTVGEKLEEAGEEVGDEIDDATDDD